jgi:hypothetical protein
MRVPQAREALQEIRERSPGTDTWQKEVTNILDAVWLQAYQEGESRVFSGPPGLIDEFGRDCGEIIETDREDSGDPEVDRYVVYVKREK